METNDTITYDVILDPGQSLVVQRHLPRGGSFTQITGPDLDDDEPFDPDCCGDPASCYAACRNSDGTPWSPACS